MTVTVHETLVDALDELRSLVRAGARPAEAQARLRRLQKRHPDADLDLVWEEEAYDGAVHYDVLLSLPGEGTVSLSISPDRALPWPLRGVHRWSEADLVRVNASVLKVEQAIACLDFIWDEAPIVDRLLHACLVQEELGRDPIDLSDAELQDAIDGFRRARRLYTAADTHRWLERRGMTQEKLEQYVTDEAIVAKLRARVAAGRVEGYFDAHRRDFDRAYIARVDFSDEEHARRVYDQIRAGTMRLCEAAQHRFLAVAGTAKQGPHETFAVLRREDGATALAPAFDAAPGDLLPPIRTDESYAVLQVLAVMPARLEAPERRAIEAILFREWLEERREAATIEWFWGNAQRTSGAARPATALSSIEGGR